jgi:hypothetical protein
MAVRSIALVSSNIWILTVQELPGRVGPGISPRASRRTGREPLGASHQANTPAIPISQCTKRAPSSVASRCRNWLARTLWSLKRSNFRIAQATSLRLTCRSKGYSANPLSSRLFGNGDGAHRRRRVASRAHPIPDLVEITLQVGIEVLLFPVASVMRPLDATLCSSPITSLHRSYESVRRSAPHRYASPAVFAAWASPFASERLVPAVPRDSLHPLHALSLRRSPSAQSSGIQQTCPG